MPNVGESGTNVGAGFHCRERELSRFRYGDAVVSVSRKDNFHAPPLRHVFGLVLGAFAR